MGVAFCKTYNLFNQLTYYLIVLRHMHNVGYGSSEKMCYVLSG